jgi:acetolactate synthase-1/2/3 large subunit
MGEMVGRAFSTALAGRQGPVVLSLPHDMLALTSRSPDAAFAEPLETTPGHAQMAALEVLLAQSARPMLILGGGRWSEAALAQMARFAERFGLPVCTSFRRAHHFDPLHANYAGDLGLGANPALVARVKASDLIIAAGARLNELTSQGYSLFDIPVPQMTLVHAYPGAEEIGRVYRPHLAIHATPQAFAAALDRLVPARAPFDVAPAHQEYLDWSEKPLPQPGPVNLSDIMIWLREHLPADAILCNGAGNYAGWIHRFYRFRRFATHVAPTSGSMGYGVPAAVGVKRLHPERTVVCVAGDGDFLMNGQEFATAVQYGLPFVILVVDNGLYGTIRMHQERDYPGRPVATELRNPDFAAYARAFGAHGATVTETAQFADALETALEAGTSALIELRIDPEAINPRTTLTKLREDAQR